jgi:hypothetical protein
MFHAEAAAADAIQNDRAGMPITGSKRRAACSSPATSSSPASSMRRPSRTRGDGSTTPTSERSAGGWWRPAPPTRTQSAIGPGSRCTEGWVEPPRLRMGPLDSARKPTLNPRHYSPPPTQLLWRPCVETLTSAGVPARTASMHRLRAGSRSPGRSTFSPCPPHVSITFS